MRVNTVLTLLLSFDDIFLIFYDRSLEHDKRAMEKNSPLELSKGITELYAIEVLLKKSHLRAQHAINVLTVLPSFEDILIF